MPRITSQEFERNLQIVFLEVQRSPLGIRQKEISDKTGFENRTVNNYLKQLEDEGKVYKEGRLWFLGEYEEIRSLKLEITPEEAYTYYLGSRLFVKQHDKRNQLAEAALMKLADALAANKLVEQEVAQAAHELAQRPGNPGYESIFQTIVRGYLQRKPVKIKYKPLNGTEFETTFRTYLIEPSAIGYSTYIIGDSSLPNARRAYKLERIQSAELDGEQYRIPADFPGLEILRNSWSIIIGEKTLRITLRFSPGVKERVLETRWHPSQEDDDDKTKTKDDHLLWWVDVADTTDMMPWIRSWGADVEIVEPEYLRKAMTKEVRRLIELYSVVELPPIPLAQRLWAKTSKDRTQTHPLLCHLIDVAQVALTVWQQVLTQSSREHFANALGINTHDAGRTIAFWIGLHDLGKACPGFQRLHKPAIDELTAAGLAFPKVMVKERCYHAMVTTCTLATLLNAETDIHRRVAKKIGQALGGHHGTWPHPNQTDGVKQNQIGSGQWDDVRRALVCHLRDLLSPARVSNLSDTDEGENAFLTLFSGFTTVADWIGSMEDYFPYVDAPVDPKIYFEQAGRQAAHALKELNWIGWQPPEKTLPFEKLFPFAPNAVQKEAVTLAPRLGESALVIVEVTTGAGKTETALYLADHQAAIHQQRGMYIAMPTMATSNQMFSRAKEFLQTRYQSDAATPLLIHSQARWMAQEPSAELNLEDEDADASVRDMSWFLPRKRSLLTPFAVGTVDQSLLSVLQTRHFFVRLFALSHKTIIFDEVHAYDVYMSELFEMLLKWLRMVGATVILLSATLPAKTRRRLVAAYTGKENAHVDQAPYPAITWASNDDLEIVPLEATEARPPIALSWIDRNPESICAILKEQLINGGCAAVICNTIARAQEIHRAIDEANLVDADDLILFHARNPFAWRDDTESKVLGRFGKNSGEDGGQTTLRPHKSIVVATQVIEQSLDLDFDLMVSDLAPIDLLLQRVGRLHRHVREQRPTGLEYPSLYIAVDSSDFSHPEFGNDKYIYAEYILLKSYLALQAKDELLLPQQTSALSEAVYGDDMEHNDRDQGDIAPNLLAKLEESYTEMLNQEKADIDEAVKRLILAPWDEDLLYQRTPGLEEDSPELHASFQALTRLGDRSISIVCLHQLDDKLNTEPDGAGTNVDLSQKPNHDQTRVLAKYTISLSNKSIVHHLLEYGEKPPAWAEHGLLRDHFVLKFNNGIVELADIKTTLRLSRTYGLEILKDK